MYIEMVDKSYIAKWGLEIGKLKNNKVIMYIPDELINKLSDSFIDKLKLLLKNNQYQSFKEKKRADFNKYGKVYDYQNIIHLPYNENILTIKYKYSYNLVKEWQNDIKKINRFSKKSQKVDN
jgi:hypothetical protein